MKKYNRIMASLLVAGAALTMAAGAQAQNSMSSIYVPGSGYVGLTAGQSDYSLDNGIGVFGSDQGDRVYRLRHS